MRATESAPGPELRRPRAHTAVCRSLGAWRRVAALEISFCACFPPGHRESQECRSNTLLSGAGRCPGAADGCSRASAKVGLDPRAAQGRVPQGLPSSPHLRQEQFTPAPPPHACKSGLATPPFEETSPVPLCGRVPGVLVRGRPPKAVLELHQQGCEGPR